MDANIESKSEKDLAKKHVDLLGAYLQSLYRITNKGVHSNLNRFESIKTVMHIYLLCADLLNYLDKDKFLNKKPNIHSASLDEIEAIGNVPRKIAKEIVKLRVKNLCKGLIINKLTLKALQNHHNAGRWKREQKYTTNQQ